MYVPAAISFTVIGDDAPVPVMPLDEVTVYDVIGSLPFAGAVNVTDTTPPLPPDAEPIVGTPGAPLALDELDVSNGIRVKFYIDLPILSY